MECLGRHCIFLNGVALSSTFASSAITNVAATVDVQSHLFLLHCLAIHPAARFGAIFLLIFYISYLLSLSYFWRLKAVGYGLFGTLASPCLKWPGSAWSLYVLRPSARLGLGPHGFDLTWLDLIYIYVYIYIYIYISLSIYIYICIYIYTYIIHMNA